MLIPLTGFALSCPQLRYLNKQSTECLQILLIDFVTENVHHYHDHSHHHQPDQLYCNSKILLIDLVSENVHHYHDHQLDQIQRSNCLILSQKMSRPSSAPGSPVVAGRQTAAVGRGVRSRFFHFFWMRGKFQIFFKFHFLDEG